MVVCLGKGKSRAVTWRPGDVGGSRSIRLLSALGDSQRIAVSSALFVVLPVALLRYN